MSTRAKVDLTWLTDKVSECFIMNRAYVTQSDKACRYIPCFLEMSNFENQFYLARSRARSFLIDAINVSG
jgi:hypothetical protein